MSLFHMFLMYAVIRGQLGVRQQTPSCEPDSIVKGSDNHRTGLWYFMIYDCTMWGLLWSWPVSFLQWAGHKQQRSTVVPCKLVIIIVHACDLCNYTRTVGARQLFPHHKPHSIVKSSDNHRTGIWCFMICALWGLLGSLFVSFLLVNLSWAIGVHSCTLELVEP